MPLSRRLTAFLVAALLAIPALGAHAQAYTSIVVFGDSLSDTGNDADLSGAKYGIRIPGLVADYTDGRFTDGTLTYPASYKYAGVWVEQLAAMLPPKPAVSDSLDGGRDYAYGFATAGMGTGNFTFGPGNVYSVTVDNVGLQITNYLATHPKINNSTLFIVWAGANDLLNATSQQQISTAAIHQALNVEQLIEAGATHILVPNLPPLGLTPRLNGSPYTSIPANQASYLFNQTLAGALDIVQAFNFTRRVHVFRLDIFGLITQVVGAPANYGLANVTNSSQATPVDPDTYLFWDDIHPTTHGHNIVANAALQLITAPPPCQEGRLNLPPCVGLPPRY